MPDNLAPTCIDMKYGKHIRHSKKIAQIDVRLIRNIYFKPKGWLIIIDNISNSNENIEFSNNIHFAPEFEWNESGASLVQKNNGANKVLSIDYYSNVPLTTINSEGGDLNEDMNGFISREYKSIEKCPYIKFSGFGNAIMAVVLNLSEETISLCLDDNKITLVLSDKKLLLQYD